MKAILANTSTRAPQNFKKDETKAKLPGILEELNKLQTLLYAGQKHSLLVILQGLDASGKDGAINNVFTSVNPQGIFVKSFKQPTQEELAHDFLWRVHQHTPAKGMIHVFNRSHYEDIIITRVHKWIDDDVANKRMKAINDFERLLTEHNHTHILKFYLHVSQEEQQERLQERTTDATKQWKYSENDLKEAKLWDDYMKAYEDCFSNCNKVPWTIVPADQNWYKEYVIASTVLDTLSKLKMEYPGRKTE
jgi:PPK2 family polyphosphate:nucleotide phosphotransferase